MNELLTSYHLNYAHDDDFIRDFVYFSLMKQELVDEMVQQLNAEFESYYIYLSMTGYFESHSWDGLATWMHLQSEEEREHAMKFYNHLIQRGINPELLAINAPQNNWESPLAVFEEAFKHEQKISEKIHHLMDKAIELKDHGAQNLLSWFVDEQLEEEATVGAIVERLRRVASDPNGMMLMDAELGKREEKTL